MDLFFRIGDCRQPVKVAGNGLLKVEHTLKNLSPYIYEKKYHDPRQASDEEDIDPKAQKEQFF